jgi:hypothetical protein
MKRKIYKPNFDLTGFDIFKAARVPIVIFWAVTPYSAENEYQFSNLHGPSIFSVKVKAA